MDAASVMTRDVATASPDTLIEDAIATMVSRRVSGLPVVDKDGALVGVFTEGDLLRRAELGTEMHHSGWLRFLRGPEREAADYVRANTHRVGDLMTGNPVSAEPTTPLDEVVQLMEARHIKRVPIVSAGRLVGVVSRFDLVRALGVAIRATRGAPQGDEAIRTALRDELQAQDWFRSCNVIIEVKDGAVRIEGSALERSAPAALRVAAEKIPGVRSVEIAVDFIDPIAAGAIA